MSSVKWLSSERTIIDQPVKRGLLKLISLTVPFSKVSELFVIFSMQIELLLTVSEISVLSAKRFVLKD